MADRLHGKTAEGERRTNRDSSREERQCGDDSRESARHSYPFLGGAGKLSDVEPLEARRIKEFGYVNSTEKKPLIRLACMAKASGNATIVIPPWNGILGKAGLGGA